MCAASFGWRYWFKLISCSLCQALADESTTAVCTESNGMPQWIAHQGEAADAPPNTLAAFRLAWKRGCPAIELDIHLTSDNEILCSHDADTARCCGEKLVIEQTPLSRLRQCDAGFSKDEKFRGEKLPLLSEVLAEVPPHGCVLVEIKCGRKIVGKLKECIENSKLRTDQIILICFNRSVLHEAGQALPGRRTLLLDSVKHGQEQAKLEQLQRICSEDGFCGVDLSFESPVTPEFVKAFHQRDLLVYTWTVDNEAVAQEQLKAGVDGITSNCAARLMSALPDNVRDETI